MNQPDAHELKSTIHDFILKEFLPGEDPSRLTDTTPLMTGGILDSIASVKLVSFLEERYGVEFKAHEISARYIDTIATLTSLLTKKLQSLGS